MLTNKQNEVIRKFWKNGKFRVEDLIIVYSTLESRIECINRLSALKIIINDPTTNQFKINRERFLEMQDD